MKRVTVLNCGKKDCLGVHNHSPIATGDVLVCDRLRGEKAKW